MTCFKFALLTACLALAGCSFKSSESQQKSPAVFVENLGVVYHAPERSVDTHLALTNHYNYQFRFKPQFNPDAATSRNNPTLTLPPGTKVRVRAMLLHPEAQPQVELAAHGAPLPSSLQFPWLASFEETTTIPESGYIDLKVALPVRYLFRPQLTARTPILLELTPESPGIKLASTLLQGNFRTIAPPAETGPTLLFQVPEAPSLDALIQRVPHRTTICSASFSPSKGTCLSAGPEWTLSALDLFVDYWEKARPLELLSLDADLGSKWQLLPEWLSKEEKSSWTQLETLVSTDSFPKDGPQILDRWLTQLCLRVPSSVRTHCTQYPRVHFRVDRVTLMDSLEQFHPGSDLRTFPIEVSANFFREQLVSEKVSDGNRNLTDQSHTFQTKVAYEVFGTGGGYVGSIGKRDETYSIDEFSVQSDLRTRIQYKEQFNFMVEQSRVPLTGQGRICLLARVLPAGSLVEPTIPNYLLCGKKARMSTTESFYYAWDQSPHLANNVTDSREASLKGLSTLVRGDAGFERLKNSITDGVRLMVFRKIEPIRDDANRIVANAFFSPEGWSYRGEGGELPGVLGNASLTPFRWQKEAWEQVLRACSGLEPGESKLGSEVWRKWQRRYQYCTCFYDPAARQWSYASFEKDFKDIEQTLDKLSVHKGCSEWVKAVWP